MRAYQGMIYLISDSRF